MTTIKSKQNPLSEREKEIMQWLRQFDLSYAYIAKRLNIEVSTLKLHINNINRALGTNSRIGVVWVYCSLDAGYRKDFIAQIPAPPITQVISS